MAVLPLNKIPIVKKRTAKFVRHQSDRFKTVKVAGGCLYYMLMNSFCLVALMAQTERY